MTERLHLSGSECLNSVLIFIELGEIDIDYFLLIFTNLEHPNRLQRS